MFGFSRFGGLTEDSADWIDAAGDVEEEHQADDDCSKYDRPLPLLQYGEHGYTAEDDYEQYDHDSLSQCEVFYH